MGYVYAAIRWDIGDSSDENRRNMSSSADGMRVLFYLPYNKEEAEWANERAMIIITNIGDSPPSCDLILINYQVIFAPPHSNPAARTMNVRRGPP